MKILTNMLLFSLAFLAVSADAEIQKFGDLDVNYNVITTDTLAPQVAKDIWHRAQQESFAAHCRGLPGRTKRVFPGQLMPMLRPTPST